MLTLPCHRNGRLCREKRPVYTRTKKGKQPTSSRLISNIFNQTVGSTPFLYPPPFLSSYSVTGLDQLQEVEDRWRPTCAFDESTGWVPRSTQIVPTIRLYGPDTVMPTTVITSAFNICAPPMPAYEKSAANEANSIVTITGLRQPKRSFKKNPF